MTTKTKRTRRTPRQMAEAARAQLEQVQQQVVDEAATVLTLPAAPEPPGSAPVAVSSEISTVLDFLQRLEARLAAVESQSPITFVPQAVDSVPRDTLANTYIPPNVTALRATMIRSLNASGQTISRSIGPMENPEMLDKIPAKYHPIYRSGDLVRLNPEKQLHGSDKLIGEMLEEKASAGEGEIVRIQGLTKSYQPKYSVYIRGLTTRNGDGFLESQLLPA
jgi:hypothetical protein